MKNEKKFQRPTREIAILNCKAPALFSIPKDIFENELQRVPDRDWFKKILKLEKASEQLKAKFIEYSARYQQLLEQAKQMMEIPRK